MILNTYLSASMEVLFISDAFLIALHHLVHMTTSSKGSAKHIGAPMAPLLRIYSYISDDKLFCCTLKLHPQLPN